MTVILLHLGKGKMDLFLVLRHLFLHTGLPSDALENRSKNVAAINLKNNVQSFEVSEPRAKMKGPDLILQEMCCFVLELKQ